MANNLANLLHVHTSFLYISIDENTGQPIFGVQINYNIKDGDPLIFASVGSNRVSIPAPGFDTY